MSLPATYHDLKDFLVQGSGLSHSLLHVHAGMLIYLLTKVIQQNRRGSVLPVIVVFSAAILNEVMDRSFFGSWRYQDTLGDMINTLLWPTAITLVTIYRRRQWGVERRYPGWATGKVRVVAREMGQIKDRKVDRERPYRTAL